MKLHVRRTNDTSVVAYGQLITHRRPLRRNKTRFKPSFFSVSFLVKLFNVSDCISASKIVRVCMYAVIRSADLKTQSSNQTRSASEDPLMMR